VLLILFGVYLLYVRLAGAAEQAGGENHPEVRHDHR
jgi:hypothetical protein